jgi:hypothetical protein
MCRAIFKPLHCQQINQNCVVSSGLLFQFSVSRLQYLDYLAIKIASIPAIVKIVIFRSTADILLVCK